MMDLQRLVEPDRVHKSVYTDPAIFDAEMERIWERIWVYCGHESQVKHPGDYHAVQIGRQPMVMVRQADGHINVLYNRCPHRGVQLVGNQSGNTGNSFVCSYHAWSFHLDGSVRAIPLAKGYEGTRLTRDNPDLIALAQKTRYKSSQREKRAETTLTPQTGVKGRTRTPTVK